MVDKNRMRRRLLIAAAIAIISAVGAFRVLLPYSRCREATLELDRLQIQSQDKVGPGFEKVVAKAEIEMDKACSSR